MYEPTPQWQPRDLLAERNPDLDLALKAWDAASDAAINADRDLDSTLLNNMRAQAIKLGLDTLLRKLSAQTGVSEAGGSYALIAVSEYLLSDQIKYEDAISVLQAPEITDRERIVAVLYAGAVVKSRQDSIDLIVNRLAADTANSDELAARCYIQIGDLTVNGDAEYALNSYSRAIRKIGAAGINELRGPCFRGLARCWLQQKKYEEAAKAASEARGFYEQSGDASGAESAMVFEAMAYIGGSNYDAAHLSTLVQDLVQRGHPGLAQRLSARMQGTASSAPGSGTGDEHGGIDQGASASLLLQEFESRARGVLALAGARLMSGDLAAVVAAGEPLLLEARQLGALNVEIATAYMLGETALIGRRFEDSIRLLESVVEKARDVLPTIYASALNKIGTVYTQMGKADIGLSYQQRAMDAHRERKDWSALVVDLVQAAQSCVNLQRLDQAQAYADEIEILGPKYPPADAEWVTSVPALVAALRGHGEKAKDGFRATIAELERKRKQFKTADQQRVWGRQKADLYGQAIEAAILRDDGAEAIAYFELARNRYLNTIAREKSTPEPMSKEDPSAELWAPGSPTTDSLAALLPPNGSFVWCAAFVRGMGIVAASWRQDKVELACRFYPEITYEVIVRLGQGEIGNDPSDLLERMEMMKQQMAAGDQAKTGAFWQSGEGEDWNRRIQRIAESVRAIVWPRIFETIGEPTPLVVLLPSVGCTELPLAAAAPDRWPGDVPLSVCFAPSLASLTPLDALDCTAPQTLTQVENPTEDISLACCSLESEAVGALFATRPLVVRGRRAHRGRVMELIAGADIFHFMGHAWCDWHEPLDSSLLCAARSDEQQALTVRELFKAGRIKARLIVLSACEISNVQPGDKQNDFINLPAALVALGARCVIAPRWRVDDVAASMFSANLFERWLTGASLMDALAGARLWLRDEVTRSIVEKWLDNRDSQSPDAGRLDDIKRSFKEKYSPADRPFSPVVHWGAFELTGDPYPFGVTHA